MSLFVKLARRLLPSLVVVVAGVLLTAGIFVTLRNLEGENARAAFDSVARERLDALETNVALTVDNLISVDAFFDASQRFDRAAFARFAAALLAQNKAIQALEWIPRVPKNLRSDYERSARQDGFPSFQFTERLPHGEMVRAGDREEYFPVFFVEPFAGNEKAVGYDLASNSVRRAALQRSAATGRMIATSRVVLVQETADQYGALVFHPVYWGDRDPQTEQSRRAALIGFALGVFRIQDMVEKTGAIPNPASGLRIAIFDRDAELGERLLYPKGARFDSAEDLPKNFRTMRTIQVGGRTWEMFAYPLPSAFQPSHWSSWSALAAGLLLTSLLTVHLAARKSAELALQRSEERARMLFGTIPLPVWVCDLRTLDFLEVNPAAIEHYGYSRDEFLRMKVADIQPPDELERLATKVQQIRKAKQFSGSSKHRTRDGRVIQVEISSHRLRYEGHLAVLVVAQDVTARVRLEMDLRHAQKLEAVGGLAAGIAHEINTPIQFVGDNTHFLQGAFDDLAKVLAKYRQLHQAAANGGAGRELAEEVTKAEKSANLDFLMQEIPSALEQSMDGVTRVATIVKAMREFAHTDRGEKIATDLNKNLQSTLIVARNEIKYVADVETDFQELPLVKCNGGDVNQVFLNLLVNAAHAIKDRREPEAKKGVIGIRTRREGDHVVISISDTGCGIPANIHDKIFEPFFTTKEVGRGTGQGLAIARTIVERHGGSITFDTEVGRGTTFHIRLPIRLE
ncbi:MAG TPA: CHASE domain-containing protein [Terriglobales bacterium]|nr:CHASE domain-containing protein [Terriglobales bacterium]